MDKILASIRTSLEKLRVPQNEPSVITNAPPGSVVLVDEAHLLFSARESQMPVNRELTRVLNLARQRRLGIIFVAHEARHLEKNILSSVDTLILKKPAPFQTHLERWCMSELTYHWHLSCRLAKEYWESWFESHLPPVTEDRPGNDVLPPFTPAVDMTESLCILY